MSEEEENNEDENPADFEEEEFPEDIEEEEDLEDAPIDDDDDDEEEDDEDEKPSQSRHGTKMSKQVHHSWEYVCNARHKAIEVRGNREFHNNLNM